MPDVMLRKDWDKPQPQPQSQLQPQQTQEAWLDQFNQNIILTVQALQRLHHAFDSKFSR